VPVCLVNALGILLEGRQPSLLRKCACCSVPGLPTLLCLYAVAGSDFCWKEDWPHTHLPSLPTCPCLWLACPLPPTCYYSLPTLLPTYFVLCLLSSSLPCTACLRCGEVCGLPSLVLPPIPLQEGCLPATFAVATYTCIALCLWRKHCLPVLPPTYYGWRWADMFFCATTLHACTLLPTCTFPACYFLPSFLHLSYICTLDACLFLSVEASVCVCLGALGCIACLP